MNSESHGSAHSVQVEQAVFTSIRSPMGEGYRVVAASPGVRTEEKAELTRRSPSHGSLCADGDSTLRLLAYPLASGRYAVGFVQHAGTEHTSRGGQRVYTHYALLDASAAERFHWHVLRVLASLQSAVGGNLVLKPVAGLKPLILDLNSATGPLKVRTGAGVVDGAIVIASAALAGKSLLIAGSHDEAGLLSGAIHCLPASIRSSVSISVGVKYSPTRPSLISLVARDQGETQRLVRGQPVTFVDWTAGPTGLRESSPYESWLEFARRRLMAERSHELEDMVGQLTADAGPEQLQRLALLGTDLDAVARSDAESLERIGRRWAGTEGASSPESTLIKKLMQSVAARHAELQNEAETAGVGCGPRPVSR